MLDWIGKSKVVNHHLDVPYHVLDRKWDFGGDAASGNKDQAFRRSYCSSCTLPVEARVTPARRVPVSGWRACGSSR